MSEIYNAPKPRYSYWAWFKFIAIRIIFPPLLIWDSMKFLANKFLGQSVGMIVLPAQKSSSITWDCASIPEQTHEKFSVQTHDKAVLDTLEIKHNTQASMALEYHRYVIRFLGKQDRYEENVDSMLQEAKELAATVIGFNYRGVGQSKGKTTSKQTLVTDGIAQVQRLLDQGVPPANITLKGFSLGGAVASLVAYHFHQLGQPVFVYNSRSFSSTTDYLVGRIRLSKNGNQENPWKIVFGWLAKPVIKFGVALVNWEIDAGNAFKNIPQAYREYIVVRSSKIARHGRVDDGVIPHYASIHRQLQNERHKQKVELDKQIEKLRTQINFAVPSEVPGLYEERTRLINIRSRIKSSRKMIDPTVQGRSHNLSSERLSNRFAENEKTFFQQFIIRTAPQNAPYPTLPII